LNVTGQGAAEVEFLRLGREDLDSLLDLEGRCFSTPWSRKEFEHGLAQDKFHVFGFKQDRLLLGYISFYKVRDEMEILNIAVRPESREMGLGSRMLSTVLRICARLGTRRAYLEVRPSNTAAQRLYEKHGFLPIGVRPQYYRDTGEDAIIMRADISPVPSTSPS
jgi:[ribosomal protein S18]-alanine N-acetyltransferase